MRRCLTTQHVGADNTVFGAATGDRPLRESAAFTVFRLLVTAFLHRASVDWRSLHAE
jgi:hypothetical protein